jgi:hypothetical protein
MRSVRAIIFGLVLLALPAEAMAGALCHGKDRPVPEHCTAPPTPGEWSVMATLTYAGCQSALACREQVPLVPDQDDRNDLPALPFRELVRPLPSLFSAIADGPPTPPPNG